jgi:hypothetical protein
MSTKEKLEKAGETLKEYLYYFPNRWECKNFDWRKYEHWSYKDLEMVRNLIRQAVKDGVDKGIRIGFEAGREIYSADEGTNSYRYNIEDFLKEIE